MESQYSSSKLKEVEFGTLRTFKKHRPSEYFSHLKNDENAFNDHIRKVENLFRYGLSLPLGYFKDKTVIDLGSGTGDNLIALALWGAKCTLVEMNEDALNVAKEVFKKYSPNYNDHTFINSSLYDIDVKKLGQFDISHSRGVFTHVADKSLAFNILNELTKPGGYLIYGDRNTAGGIQEMLQRYVIYKLGGISDEKMIEISETLFFDDIDRSQNSVPRTREAIIFDRWVIQQQDDPSVNDVISMMEKGNLDYISSWPRIDFAGRGVSTYTNPKDLKTLKKGARIVENLWMLLNKGEYENINSYLSPKKAKYLEELEQIETNLRNLQINTEIDALNLKESFAKLNQLSKDDSEEVSLLRERERLFFEEVSILLDHVSKNSPLLEIRKSIDKFKILFKGYLGVRHVDYVAYKPSN